MLSLASDQLTSVLLPSGLAGLKPILGGGLDSGFDRLVVNIYVQKMFLGSATCHSPLLTELWQASYALFLTHDQRTCVIISLKIFSAGVELLPKLKQLAPLVWGCLTPKQAETWLLACSGSPCRPSCRLRINSPHFLNTCNALPLVPGLVGGPWRAAWSAAVYREQLSL